MRSPTVCQPVCECVSCQLLQLHTCPHALLDTKRKDLTHCQHTHAMFTQHLQPAQRGSRQSGVQYAMASAAA